MKSKNLKTAILCFAAMSCLSIILWKVTGNNDLIIEYISYLLLILLPPIFYISSIVYIIKMIRKKDIHIIVSISLLIFVTITFLCLYGIAVLVILIG